MSYASGYFIYGINFTARALERFQDELDELAGEDIVEVLETANGRQTLYLGITIGGIAEGINLAWHDLVQGKAKISAAIKDGSPENQAFGNILNNFLLEDISEDLREWVAKQEPEVFLAWSGS